MSLSILGTRLKELRIAKDLSQGQVAQYAGVSQSTLSDIERGEIAPKTIDAIVNLAAYFDCSTDYLLGQTSDPTRRDAPPLSETMKQVLLLGRQLSTARQRDLLDIAETFIAKEPPGFSVADVQAKATGRKPDAPRIIGAE